MTPDMKLSEHFSLYELTHTDNEGYQAANRELTNEQLQKLGMLALHAEAIREICGVPLRIHSGYRADRLNGATLGSSSTSQHPKCEAIDFDAKDQPLLDSFNKILDAAEAGKFKFGQLILERAQRPYGAVEWLHCSVPGLLPPEKVGQVMKMTAANDGKPHYELVKKLEFKEALL